jgi:hypothetical protein
MVWACVETEQVSPIPEITFNKFEVYIGYDSSLNQYLTVGELEFDFIDGDADIGIYEDEVDTVTWNENNYNVFLKPYQKIDTAYITIEPDCTNPPPYYTIWHDDKLDRVGQNKTIKGTITITIWDIPRYDTIRYDFYIRDRAGNNSNTETTTDVGTNLD